MHISKYFHISVMVTVGRLTVNCHAVCFPIPGYSTLKCKHSPVFKIRPKAFFSCTMLHLMLILIFDNLSLLSASSSKFVYDTQKCKHTFLKWFLFIITLKISSREVKKRNMKTTFILY